MAYNELTIHPYDDVHIKIECERSLAKELSDYFTFTVPNYQFTPAYKNKTWDGQIRLFNLHTQTIYAGLLDYIVRFSNDRNYTCNVELNKNKVLLGDDDVSSFIDSLDIPMEPYSHQIEAIKYGVNKDRCLLLSPTGSGKSLMIYVLIRYFLDKLPDDKKILIIVPTTGLVSQMYNDFENYSEKSDWSCEDNIHVIFSGQSKQTDKRIVISTWQSIHNMNEKYFYQFGSVFGDECHLFKAKSLIKIMTKLKQCPYRIGTTGTLDGSQTHKLVIEGLFGKVYNVTSTKELMDKDLLSNLSIDCINLKYNEIDVQEVKRVKYIDEIKWIINNKKRNDFIINLCRTIKGNTLLLFNYVKEHGIPLYERLQETCTDKKVFLIHGGTDISQREEIRQIVDKEKNAILVASYGTCSTGINIKNINNIIFASPSKSVIRVLQSIGRGLRRSENKNKVKLYDISDDMRYKKYTNHTYRHFQDRIEIYIKEKFDYKTVVIQMD